MRRAERLYEKTLDYRKRVAGPADAYTLNALRRIRAFASQPIQLASDDLVPAILREIHLLYPEKAAYLGNGALETLISKGRDGARIQRFSTIRGTILVVVLMLAFGHGCGTDPLYPWIAKTLKDETITDPKARVIRLEKRRCLGSSMYWPISTRRRRHD